MEGKKTRATKKQEKFEKFRADMKNPDLKK